MLPGRVGDDMSRGKGVTQGWEVSIATDAQVFVSKRMEPGLEVKGKQLQDDASILESGLTLGASTLAVFPLSLMVCLFLVSISF